MSEYQYYEFQASDRPLTEREIEELRALLSRAQITSVSFVNTYNWGDFKGDPQILMEKCFDAFVYVANWGTRQLMFRLPARMLDAHAVTPYFAAESATLRTKGKFVILEFQSEEEGGDWEEGEGWMASLIPLRADLMRGDLRCLYLGWWLCAQSGELDDDDLEPPVPLGLGNLSGTLEGFANFLRIETDLIEAAAVASDDLKEEAPSRDQLAAWIRAIPESEKNAMLLRLAEQDDPHFRVDLLRRFAQDTGNLNCPSVGATERRTVSALRSAAETLASKRRKREAERRAAAQRRREQEQAAARAQYLDQLAGRESELWSRVLALVQTSQPNNHDRAVSLLVDLRDLAIRSGRTSEFESNLNQFRERYAKRTSFLRRLAKAGLGTQGAG